MMQNSNSADSSKNLNNVIKINEAEIRNHLGEMVRSTVEETLNNMLDSEADRLCNAKRYERTDAIVTGGPASAIADSQNILDPPLTKSCHSRSRRLPGELAANQTRTGELAGLRDGRERIPQVSIRARTKESTECCRALFYL